MKKVSVIFILAFIVVLILFFVIFPFDKKENDQLTNAAQVEKFSPEKAQGVSFFSAFPMKKKNFGFLTWEKRQVW